MKFILVVLLYTNNPFYGLDTVPTLQFNTENECKNFVLKLKELSSPKTKYMCIEK